MENKETFENEEIKNTKKMSNERKYSNNQDLTKIKETGDPDRKHASVMDEYRRYFGVQNKCKTKNLTREEAWKFIIHFFNDAFGVDIKEKDKPETKYLGKMGDSKHKKVSYLHWNKTGYELSIETRGDVILRTSFSIYGGLGNSLKLRFKKMVKASNTIAGMQGHYSKFQMKYWHRKNAKDIFRSLKVLDEYKGKHGNIEGGFEYMKVKADKYKLAQFEKDKMRMAKKESKQTKKIAQ